jgi:hypothetical protein
MQHRHGGVDTTDIQGATLDTIVYPIIPSSQLLVSSTKSVGLVN